MKREEKRPLSLTCEEINDLSLAAMDSQLEFIGTLNNLQILTVGRRLFRQVTSNAREAKLTPVGEVHAALLMSSAIRQGFNPLILPWEEYGAAIGKGKDHFLDVLYASVVDQEYSDKPLRDNHGGGLLHLLLPNLPSKVIQLLTAPLREHSKPCPNTLVTLANWNQDTPLHLLWRNLPKHLKAIDEDFAVSMRAKTMIEYVDAAIMATDAMLMAGADLASEGSCGRKVMDLCQQMADTSALNIRQRQLMTHIERRWLDTQTPAAPRSATKTPRL